MEIYETKEWKKEIAELGKQAIQSGGGGSNMAEPLYFQPGPLIPDDLPPEEIARRKQELEGISEILDRAAAHSEATKR